MSVTRCDIMAPARMEPIDQGCPLPHAHSGPHQATLKFYGPVEWETDLECDCSCCQSDDAADWCVVWREVAPCR